MNEPAVLLGGHEAKSYSYVRASDRSQSWQPANQLIDFDSMCGVLSGPQPGGRGVCGCDAGRAGRGCRVAGELVSARASFLAPSLAPARPLTSLLPRRSVRSAHCTGNDGAGRGREAGGDAVRGPKCSWVMECHGEAFRRARHDHQWHCACVAFLSPRRCLQLASWRGRRYQISARTSAARQRVIPGRGNRTASRPGSSISLSGNGRFSAIMERKKKPRDGGTEEKSPGTGRGK